MLDRKLVCHGSYCLFEKYCIILTGMTGLTSSTRPVMGMDGMGPKKIKWGGTGNGSDFFSRDGSWVLLYTFH